MTVNYTMVNKIIMGMNRKRVKQEPATCLWLAVHCAWNLCLVESFVQTKEHIRRCWNHPLVALSMRMSSLH